MLTEKVVSQFPGAVQSECTIGYTAGRSIVDALWSDIAKIEGDEELIRVTADFEAFLDTVGPEVVSLKLSTL